MSEHEHGTMGTEVQENTFNGFVRFVTNSVILIIVFLIFLALIGA